MKITKISTTAIAMPLPPARYSHERAGTKREWGKLRRVTSAKPNRQLEYVIVEMNTDEGVTGIGEACTDIGFFGEPIEEVKSALDVHFAPRLIGMDPFNREEILRALDFRGNNCARSGIDLALHDLMGKALQVPVSVLLGGTSRTRVKVAVEIAGGPPDEMAKLCSECVQNGILAFKPKIGGIPEEDAERLKAIRDAVGPDVSIRADANQGFSPKEAIRLCRLSEQYGVGLELLEQPVPFWDLDGMAEVKRSVETLIEADEAAYTVHDVMNLIRNGSVDVINIKVAKAGGLYNAKKIAALAEAAGLKCVLGTAFGLAPKIAAKLHLAASTPIVTDAVEFTEIILHETLAKEPHGTLFMPPLDKDGCMPVPNGPGLGVELDNDLIEKYRMDDI